MTMSQQNQWDSSVAFIFAMIGAAVFVDPQGHTEPIRWYMLVGTVIILAALSNYIRKTAVLESTSPT